MSLKKIIQEQTWIEEVRRNTTARTMINMVHAQLPSHVRQEMRVAAAINRVPLFDVVACNLAYEIALVACAAKTPSLSDMMGSLIGTKATPVGCTTVAIIDTDLETGLIDRLVFARNMDWPDPKGYLRADTKVVSYKAKRKWALDVGGVSDTYESITFPGYSGVLTGCAPGRFAVSLNAIMTEEAPRMGAAPVFLLRKVLDEEATFEGALRVLCETPLITSAMFTLVTASPFGTASNAVVIERSPTKFAVRRAVQVSDIRSVLVATNDPKAMSMTGQVLLPDGLGETSDARYHKAMANATAGVAPRELLKNAEFGCTVYSTTAELMESPTLEVW